MEGGRWEGGERCKRELQRRGLGRGSRQNVPPTDFPPTGQTELKAVGLIGRRHVRYVRYALWPWCNSTVFPIPSCCAVARFGSGALAAVHQPAGAQAAGLQDLIGEGKGSGGVQGESGRPTARSIVISGPEQSFLPVPSIISCMLACPRTATDFHRSLPALHTCCHGAYSGQQRRMKNAWEDSSCFGCAHSTRPPACRADFLNVFFSASPPRHKSMARTICSVAHQTRITSSMIGPVDLPDEPNRLRGEAYW